MMKSLLRLACLVAMVLVLCPLLGARALAEGKPNIVFILIDDLGWADVGCNGSTFYETPNVDRLARQGLRFTNAYAACHVCSPTRASIMTGKYPARLQLTDFLKGRRQPKNSPLLSAQYADYLATEEVTLAEALKQAGYVTGHVGKWHLGPTEKYWPQNQGFDVNVGGFRSGMPRAYFWPQWKGNPPVEGEFAGQYLPDLLSAKACQFIEQNKDKPFFLYLAHHTVHIPIQAKDQKVKKYQRKLAAHPPKPGQQNNPFYAAMVESMDESVGRVLGTLERLKLVDNTIVVFFSDNGGLATPEGQHTPATINAPLRGGKGLMYEGGIREPFIIRWPGVTTPGSVCDELVDSIDFFPTFCQIVGVKPKTNGPIDGINIAALFKDPSARLDREALYWHYPHFSNQGGRPAGAVRMGDWKLIERYEFNTLELYNLKDDLSETTNLADKFPDRAGAMRQNLDAWLKRVNANMPRANPDYKP